MHSDKKFRHSNQYFLSGNFGYEQVLYYKIIPFKIWTLNELESIRIDFLQILLTDWNMNEILLVLNLSDSISDIGAFMYQHLTQQYVISKKCWCTGSIAV